ncbi:MULTISPECIES: SIR2 family protein [Paenarthrobacter]|uniref:SIR2 family protein n=1 Tax=Paenarthrobacter ureafaciens TaxID=37931 RepID=A0AAX3EGL1_PAEUR|nr:MULTISPECIES: SIR2 family protein [Paenarthrobacter]MDO5866208.1 SIR2 family protein [Paenarthrobacter sp. SD-2]MDO5877307.1 SIR2 family protein [Paenarthrobacter sp. SD-1]UYV92500.1 SIR2 family protein [Paenarthrobacter ureafaciens]UYV97035.1 SIR2 family protein [Paenarthrobacter ureafaciens]WIV32404.1 SIR2 family protein [Paenarthrobacter sp. R1]
MSGADIDNQVMSVLRDLDTKDHFSILLGAGASAGVGLPDWNSLSKRLLILSGAIDDDQTATAFLAAQDPALAAEAAKSSSAKWDDTLIDALYGGSVDEPEPGALHLAAAALALQHPPGAVELFTLNFDLLIERAIEEVADEVGKTVSLFTRTKGMPRGKPSDFEVHHLHGALDPITREAKDIVLTLSEFSALVVEQHPWQATALDNALQRGPLILAGTSYRDADIRSWLHGLSTATKDRVVVFLARQGLGLNKTQFEKVQEALEQQWVAIGVQPVITQDYADAAQALKELPHLEATDYLPPRQRSRNLWESCLADFEALQIQHSAILESHLEDLINAVGAPANLVLWLCDGDSSAVRWSAPDRIYKDPGSLRKVPTGHDSPWIVGKCLGSNEVMAEDLNELSDSVRRWKHVIALPITVERDGGPAFTYAAITAALSEPPEASLLDAWLSALGIIAGDWSDRLSAL